VSHKIPDAYHHAPRRYIRTDAYLYLYMTILLQQAIKRMIRVQVVEELSVLIND